MKPKTPAPQTIRRGASGSPALRRRRRAFRLRGVTLVELLVVLAVTAILLGLLMPSLQYARESARRAGCQSNLHQIWVAVRMAQVPLGGRRPNCAGGWQVNILRFMEDGFLYEELTRNPSLEPGKVSLYASRLPVLLSCPSVVEVESTIPKVPGAQYRAFSDVPVGFREPWIISPQSEMPSEQGPHAGSYNVLDLRHGTVQCVSP